ncbi:MAG: hypothetical protein WBO88_06370 [Candidatus Dechloromonas phosphoritropha]
MHQLDFEDAQQQQFDDVFDPLHRRAGWPQLVMQLLEDVVGFLVRVVDGGAGHQLLSRDLRRLGGHLATRIASRPRAIQC